MIRIFCSKIVYLFLSYYIKNINKYFVDMQIDSQIILYTDPSYVERYIIDNNIRNSFVIYVQRPCTSPKANNNKEFLINTEQMMDVNYKPWFKTNNIAYSTLNIIDYNVTNIGIIHKMNPCLDVCHIPYLFHKEGLHNECLYDVCIIGSYSDHRNKIYQELCGAKINTIFIYDKYDEYCENIMNESRIILNLHYIEETNILETIRCYQALYNKKIVISENSIYDETDELDNLIIYSPYEKIKDTVIDVLKNYDDYKRKIDNFDYNQIKCKHDTLMKNFLDKYKYYDHASSKQQ